MDKIDFILFSEVPTWLKSLRLHKYAFLFAHLTFEEMLTLSEEGLEQQGVTKGARHKIVLSIGKLRERVSQLKQLSDQMTRDKDSLRTALTELKWMLTTPIKPPFATESEDGGTSSSKERESSGSGSGTGGSPSGGVGRLEAIDPSLMS
ncbi:Protein Smaug 1 [Orchesella cincta]|uniref:Protein Smaug 1 n=1 Tax=Orchesella cincta TaxID=48709 RepID=A0A1D2NC96_ORCCI|nr:Protein Smaug 1 [Orchesella cincta]